MTFEDMTKEKLSDLKGKFQSIPGIESLSVIHDRDRWVMTINGKSTDIPFNSSYFEIEKSLRSISS